MSKLVSVLSFLLAIVPPSQPSHVLASYGAPFGGDEPDATGLALEGHRLSDAQARNLEKRLLKPPKI